MKKRLKRSNPSVFYSSIALAISAAVLFGCSSPKSVRDIKQAHDPRSVKWSSTKSPKEALVKPLFMQSKRANIELPYQEGAMKDPVTGAAIVSEQVAYTNAEQISKSSASTMGTVGSNLNLNEVQRLGEVVVTARSRFTPERDGRVDVDFVVKVPKELLANEWRVTLSPKLLHNDSIVPLKEIVLKGQTFADKQKQSYEDYENYLKSIINKSDYDSVFVDRKGINEDIKYRQDYYYNEYYKNWSRQIEYENWMKEQSAREALETASKIGYGQKIYHENARKATRQAMIDVSKGRDTTGITAYYQKEMEDYLNRVDKGAMKKFGAGQMEQNTEFRQELSRDYELKVREQVIRDFVNGKDTVGSFDKYMRQFSKQSKVLMLENKEAKKIPFRYREMYMEGRSLNDIDNQVMTDKDSIDIARHRYMFQDIAINEMKMARKDEMEKEMIPFPFEKGVRLDSIVSNDRDFIFYYKQDYPVTQGLKKLSLVMTGKVDAIDRSAYKLPKSDTLSYFISSLAQLVDTSLVFKKTKLYRDVYNRATAYVKFPAGKAAFNIGYKDNKDQIDKIISTYRTFTNEGKLIVDSIEMRVSTSLEGKYQTNAELSQKRAEALRDYLVKTYAGEINMNQLLKMNYSGEDWNTLAALIQRRRDLPNKAAILELLSTATYPDDTKAEIQKAYPNDFRIIRDSIYPMLDKADFMFNMHRPNMSGETELKVEEREGYAEGLRLLQEREYWKAIQILSNYPDYNAALALLCMGYNEKAKEVLDRLEETGGTEYLRAILNVRAGDDDQAIAHLLRACELDQSKIYRAPLDTEIRDLIRRHNIDLNSQLDSSDVPVDAATSEDSAPSTSAAEQESASEPETPSETATEASAE